MWFSFALSHKTNCFIWIQIEMWDLCLWHNLCGIYRLRSNTCLFDNRHRNHFQWSHQLCIRRKRDKVKSLLEKSESKSNFRIEANEIRHLIERKIEAKRQTKLIKYRTMPRTVFIEKTVRLPSKMCQKQTERHSTAFHYTIRFRTIYCWIYCINRPNSGRNKLDENGSWKGQWLASNGILRQIKWL